jgi:uncharacterized protein (TIGR02145 family)
MKTICLAVRIGCLALSIACFSCKKDMVPILKTSDINYVAPTSAACGGTIIDEGSSSVISRGVCWSQAVLPTIADSITIDGSGPGTYSSDIKGLTPGTTYYVRAYAVNVIGTSYGLVRSFTTSSTGNVNIPVPDLIFPESGAILDNACYPDSQIIIWSFDWDDCPGATSYNLFVMRSKVALNPVIDIILSESSYTDTILGYICDENRTDWTWKVMACVNGEWGAWSEERKFDVEPLGTDCVDEPPPWPQDWVEDVDANYYGIATIGKQRWMKENLRVTLFNNWVPIHEIADNSAWNKLTTYGYCWYNNDVVSYYQTYGALYNWNAVNSGILCPTGWHVPSEREWQIMIDFLGGSAIAGGKLKEYGVVNWSAPNSEATNESSFTALPGGTRLSSGLYTEMGLSGNFWTSTKKGDNDPEIVVLKFNNGEVVNGKQCDPVTGASVRCIRDSI